MIVARLQRSLVGVVAALQSAARGVATNRMRTVLSTLGIGIGVATLMTIYGLVVGLTRTFTEQLSALGSDTMYISNRPWMARGDWWKYRNRPPITRDDVAALASQSDLLTVVAPVVGAAAEITVGSERASGVRVLGTTSQYLDASTLKVAQGRFLSALEGDTDVRVIVIGADVATAVFPRTNPLGERVRLGPQSFTVVGVLEAQGKSMGESQDNVVLIPFEAFTRIYGLRRNIMIAVTVPPAQQFAAKDQIVEILRRSRRLGPDDGDTFSINQQSEIVKMFNEQTQAVFGVALAIGLITLLVGGIGVMNIMLVAVTERTREIGVRRALGAKKRVIMMQFLAEAAVVTMVGGTLGTAVGALATDVIGTVSPISADLSVPAMVGAVVFSGVIGLLFGTWPAYRAAQLDPIESLRYE